MTNANGEYSMRMNIGNTDTIHKTIVEFYLLSYTVILGLYVIIILLPNCPKSLEWQLKSIASNNNDTI